MEAEGETFGVGGAAGGGPGLASLRVVKGLAGGVVLGGELVEAPTLAGGVVLGGDLAEVVIVVPCDLCPDLLSTLPQDFSGFADEWAGVNGPLDFDVSDNCIWIGVQDVSGNRFTATLTLFADSLQLQFEMTEPIIASFGYSLTPWTLACTGFVDLGQNASYAPRGPATVRVFLTPVSPTDLAGGVVLGGDLAPVEELAGGVVLGGALVPVEELAGGVVLGGALVPVEDLTGGVVLGGDLVPAPYWTYYNAAGSYSFDPSVPGTATIYAVGGGGAGSVHPILMGGGRGGDSAQYTVHLAAGSYAVVVGAGGPLTGVGGADSYWEAGAACLAAGGAPGNPSTSGGGITTSGSTSLGDTAFSGGNGGTGIVGSGGGGGSSAGDSAVGNPGANGSTALGGVAPTGGGNGGHGYKVALGAAQAGFSPGGGGGGGNNANVSAAGADGKVWVYFVPD